MLGHIPEGCILEMPFSQHILHCSLRSLCDSMCGTFFFLIVQRGERHMSGVESQNSSRCLHLLLLSTITNTHLFPLYVLVSLMSSVQQIKLLKKPNHCLKETVGLPKCDSEHKNLASHDSAILSLFWIKLFENFIALLENQNMLLNSRQPGREEALRSELEQNKRSSKCV